MGAAGQTTVALLLRGSKLYIRGMARNAPSSLERGRFGLILIRVGPGPESGHSRPDPIPENPPNQSTSNNRIRHGQRLHGKGLLICLVDCGLGYSICCRLIDEFISTQPPSLTLHLIITTRDERKSHDTLSKLFAHLRQKSRELRDNLNSRVTIQSEQVDLTSLQSVHALSTHLRTTLPRLDVVFLNAGYGGLTGIKWLRAAWVIPTDLRYEITYPSYNVSAVGLTTKSQTSSRDEPALGTVFTSNVFGHYILVHLLCPLFTSASTAQRSGRVIWISSIEGYASTFTLGDMQGLAAESAYKSSKRLTDILILTSSRLSTRQYVSKFLGDDVSKSQKDEIDKREGCRPNMYLVHPGICATSFVPLPFLLYCCMVFTFYLARWLGSPWHTVSAYKGAAAPVWLALAPQKELDELEADGKSKWGSCVSRGGEESVMRTEVEGWGVRGQVEALAAKELRGRRRGVHELSMEEQERFEELGRECWQQLEGLRTEWAKRIGW